jgi:hypothetical protein
MDNTLLRSAFVHAVTEYDRLESTRQHYNRFALAQYLEAIESAMSHIEKGADVRAVLVGHFTGRLLAKLLKVAQCSPMTRADALGGVARRTSY